MAKKETESNQPAESVKSVVDTAELERVHAERETLLLERDKLELEKLRNDVAEMRRVEAGKRQSHDQVEEALAFQRNREAQHQDLCNHMKGGPGEALLNSGIGLGDNAGNYAMIQHTLPSGVTFRLCQRCGKEWYPGDKDYKWAMTRPSRNSPSSSSLLMGLMDPEKIKYKSEQQ